MTAMDDDTGVSRPRSFRQLLDAVTTIGADLDLHTVLQHIVAAATSLADARYGALGILDPSGTHLTDFLTVGIDDEARATIGEVCGALREVWGVYAPTERF